LLDDAKTAETSPKEGFRLELDDVLFVLGVLLLVGIAVYYRVPMLHFFGFYEPDGYYHFSVIRAAIENHFVVPHILDISGWPTHTQVVEPAGLYWMTLLPYAILQFLGVSYYNVMRLVPVLFGLFDMLGAYYLSRYLSKDRLFGLLVMLFVALNMGNAARTSALIYRGDTFVTAFLLVSLILAIEIFRAGTSKRKASLALLSGFFLAVCDVVWNGGSFATAVYVFAFALIVILGFAFDRKKLVSDAKYLLGAILVFFVIVQLFMASGAITTPPTFAGSYFFLLFAAMCVGWLLADLLLGDRVSFGKGSIALPESYRHSFAPFIDTPYMRFATAMFFILIAVGVIYLVIPSFVYEIFIGNGFVINSSFAATIQELQPPTPSFIFASFNYQTYLSPMSLILLASTYAPQYIVELWALLLLAFAPYFFMKVYDSRGFMGGSSRLAFDFDAGLLVLIALFALTAYLQMNAIRFNSLLSVPLSIFSAFTVYWLLSFAKKWKYAYYAGYVLLAVLVVYLFLTASQYVLGLYPADNINTPFINAMFWMRNGTLNGTIPGNSVVLTLWPDGSLVEGIANLTSVTDSVGSQNISKADPFAAWLFNSSDDGRFLTSSINGRPDYLVVRTSWMTETGGIFTESEIDTNASYYGYNQFTGVNENINATTQKLTFFDGSGLTEVTTLQNVNGIQTVGSYARINNMSVSPFEYVELYDMDNGNFTLMRQNEFNRTNNQTFLIVYSKVPNSTLYFNVTNAYLLGTGIAGSNLVKLLFECNNYACAWDNNAASLHLDYVNSDTKIYSIVYNQSG